MCHLGWVDKVRPQVWDIFKKEFGDIQANMIEEHEMLMDLPHITDVGSHGEIVVLGKETNRQKFADAANAYAIDLDKVHGLELEVILELDGIGHVLAGSNLDGGNRARDTLMPDDIIGMGWFFDPKRIDVA